MPAGPPDLSLILPTYNERDRLEELVTAVFTACDHADVHLELIVVDDNSPDGTGRVADELATTRRMKVVHRSGKLGLGTAVVAGFGAARCRLVPAVVRRRGRRHPGGANSRVTRTIRGASAAPESATRVWSFRVWWPAGDCRSGRSARWRRRANSFGRPAARAEASRVCFPHATAALAAVRRQAIRQSRWAPPQAM